MTLFWSKLFYKCVMTLFGHNTQPKCATITLFPHMPFFRHQRVLRIGHGEGPHVHNFFISAFVFEL